MLLPVIAGSREAKPERRERCKAEGKGKLFSPPCQAAGEATSGSLEQRTGLWVMATQRCGAPAYREAGGLWDAGPPPRREDSRGRWVSCTTAPGQLPEERRQVVGQRDGPSLEGDGGGQGSYRGTRCPRPSWGELSHRMGEAEGDSDRAISLQEETNLGDRAGAYDLLHLPKHTLAQEINVKTSLTS